MHPTIAERIEVVRDVLERRWVRICLAIWAASGVWDLALSQWIPEEYAKKLPKVYQVVAMTTGLFSWQAWALVGAAIVALGAIEYAVRHKRRLLSLTGEQALPEKRSLRRGRRVIPGLMMAAGITLFVMGLVLYLKPESDGLPPGNYPASIEATTVLPPDKPHVASTPPPPPASPPAPSQLSKNDPAPPQIRILKSTFSRMQFVCRKPLRVGEDEKKEIQRYVSVRAGSQGWTPKFRDIPDGFRIEGETVNNTGVTTEIRRFKEDLYVARVFMLDGFNKLYESQHLTGGESVIDKYIRERTSEVEDIIRVGPGSCQTL